MMNKIISFIFLFITLLIIPKSAEAHVLKTDYAIGAVMHMNPEDDPIAGEPTQFFFAIKDKHNAFSTRDCDCQIIITQQGKQLTKQTTTQDQDNTTELLASYTFPQKDMYQVTLRGKPITQNAFKPFTLTYDIRVARETETQQSPQNPYLLPSIIGAIILVLLFSIFLKKR